MSFLAALALGGCVLRGLGVPSAQIPIARPLTQVADPTAPPYRSVCHLHVHRSYRAYNATGALIARTRVLTAAHNVYSPPINRISDSEVRCGGSGDVFAWAPPERFNWRNQHTSDGYHWGLFDRDYALVHLPVGAPNPADFRLLRPDEAAPDSGDIVHVAGFPWTSGYLAGTMYETEGRVLKVTLDLIYYDADLHPGMSGGPVWIRRGGEFVVVGIHVTGTDSTRLRPAQAIARRIDEEAFSTVARWVEADTAP